MSLGQIVRQTFRGLVDNGNIRYQALPVASVAIADDAAWDQLFAAAGAPSATQPCWLCGFVFSIATGLIVAENTMLFDVGWGGADGAAVAAANVVITNWPVSFSAVAAALGPFQCEAQMLPYPVKIPPASRMAARIAASPIGGVAVTEFRVILATAIQ
jgi:hypothetical protein